MNLADMLESWRNDDLRAYMKLLGGSSKLTRKADRIRFICETMRDQASLDDVWQQMDDVSRRAVSVAHHNEGEFNRDAFVAQYGSMPPRPKSKQRYSYSYSREPILFDLFVIGGQVPDDLMPLLAGLVLPLERFQVEGLAEEPSSIDFKAGSLDVTAVETEMAGRNDLLTYLRLMEQNQLRFADKSGRLTAGSLRKVLANLMEGDFREPEKKVTAGTTIRPTGLDVFAQESGLATRRGTLTEAGRTYLHTQDPEVMLEAFETWTNDGKYDELQRIDKLGGLTSRRTRLTEPASRRERVVEALSWCPAGEWIRLDDFYRALLAWHFDFDVEETRFTNLYVGSRYYGELGGQDYWAIVNGLYINVVLWELLGTVGAVDVAFLEDDYYSLVDSGTLSIDGPVSLYDGLTHIRINPWGAYLLGQVDEYVPSRPAQKTLFTVDAEHRVHLLASLSPNERMQLELMAAPVDSSSYQLEQTKILDAVEEGQKLEHLVDFLRDGNQGDLSPATVEWLQRLERNRGVFKRSGDATLIQLKHRDALELVRQDEALAARCTPVDERTIMVRKSQLSRVGNRLKELGYLLA